jgi:hypothetical protein
VFAVHRIQLIHFAQELFGGLFNDDVPPAEVHDVPIFDDDIDVGDCPDFCPTMNSDEEWHLFHGSEDDDLPPLPPPADVRGVDDLPPLPAPADSCAAVDDSMADPAGSSARPSAVINRSRAVACFVFPNGAKLSLYKSGDYEAVCPPDCGHGRCRKTRTGTAPSRRLVGSKPFQGRPLGFLVAWCLEAGMGLCDDARSHSAFLPSRADRLEARRWLAAQGPTGLALLAGERPKRTTDGEESEPEGVP